MAQTTKAAAKAAAKAKSGAVVPRASAAVDSPKSWGSLAGAGFQNQSRDDITLPFLTIVQGNPPALADNEAAKDGMWYNTVTGEVYGSDVVVVPVFTEKAYVEWRPDRGGFAGVHSPTSDVVADAKADAAERGRKFNELQHGENDLEETFYVYCLVLGAVDHTAPKEFAVLAFKSTWIKHYRKANTGWRTRPGLPPLFANRVRLSSKIEKDGKYTWWVPVLKPALGETWEDASLPMPENIADSKTWHPLLLAGKDMEHQVEAGLVRPDFSTEVREATPESGSDDTPY